MCIGIVPIVFNVDVFLKKICFVIFYLEIKFVSASSKPDFNWQNFFKSALWVIKKPLGIPNQ